MMVRYLLMVLNAAKCISVFIINLALFKFIYFGYLRILDHFGTYGYTNIVNVDLRENIHLTT